MSVVNDLVKYILRRGNQSPLNEWIADRISKNELLTFQDEVAKGEHPGLDYDPEVEARVQELVMVTLAEQLEDAAADIRAWVDGAGNDK